mgnify:CR=1 FL=1
MVQEHRGEYPSLWAAIESIAPKIGCVPQTLLDWVKQAEVDARLAALDLHPTGPLWGEGDPPSGAGVLERELALAGREPALCRWLAKAGMAHERRILRLPIAGLTWHYPEPEIVQLQFVLPAGCFATAVVRELVDLLPAGQTDSPCEF